MNLYGLKELLALEERIGNVNTGVSEETISSHLKQSKYTVSETESQEPEPCCICQVLIFLTFFIISRHMYVSTIMLCNIYAYVIYMMSTCSG